MTIKRTGHGFMGFARELRRRKVFRVAVLYLAAAFGVLEAVDILQGVMRLPAGFLPTATVLVVLGFPLALAAGWIWDFTDGSIRRTPVTVETSSGSSADSSPQAPAAGVPRGWPLVALLLVTALSMGAAGWTVHSMDPVPPAPTAGAATDPTRVEFASIAVLPFLNLSGDPKNDYFGHGLAEEVSNVLSRIDGLRVAARTSAFALRDRGIDARQIGDTLGVGMLLEGSVRRAGDRIRVSAQLIRAVDGLSLWSDSWDRELTTANVFAIQDEITGSIASELERELAPAADRLAERRTSDLGAYDLYLLGRHSWVERTPEGLRRAVELFGQSLERDSAYALAWAGLADAWEARPFFDRSVAMAEAERVARPAALRSLRLGPELAEAHAALGVILSDYDYDYEEAIVHLQRALELNPNYAQAWSWLCVARTMAGDPASGLQACDRAVTLDPLYAVPRAQRALALMALDRDAEALAALESADDLGPLTWVLAVAMRLELNRADEVDDDLVRTGAALGLTDPERMRVVGAAIRGEAEGAAGLAVVRDLESAGRIGFLELAPLYAWIGATDEALRVFETAVAERDPWLPFVVRVSSFDPIRDELRFVAGLDSLDLPDGSSAASP